MMVWPRNSAEIESTGGWIGDNRLMESSSDTERVKEVYLERK